MGDATPATDPASHRARYTDRPLPDYRHIPGRTPHPTRDPAGHSYGRAGEPLPDLNLVPWRSCDEYLYGLDLFNEGYWWECHEVLENLWHVAGLGTAAGHALQALIQCAAAHLKVVCGQTVGARRLVDHAQAHADWGGARGLGLDLRAVVAASCAHVTEGAPPVRLELTPRAGGDKSDDL